MAAVLAIGCAERGEQNTQSAVGLRSLIPAEFAPTAHEVPRAENALSNWLFATEHLVRCEDSDNSIALSQFGRFQDSPRIGEEQRSFFRDHVTTNRAALAAFSAGLEQKSFGRDGATNRFSLSALKSLIELRDAETRFLVEEGRWGEAGSRLEVDVRLPRLLSSDGQDLIDLLLALAFQGRLNERLQFLATCPQAPPETLRILGSQIYPSTFDRPFLLRAFRCAAYSDLTNFGSFSRLFITPGDQPSGLQSMIFTEDFGTALPDLILDPELLRRHPKPLDLDKTVSILSKHYLETLRALEEPSARIDVEKFPKETAALLIEDSRTLAEAAENLKKPLSRDDAERLSVPYRQIENPVGRLLMTVNSLGNFPMAEKRLERIQTTTKITRLALDLTLFQREHSRWPDNLQELPAAKAAPDLATDPFSGEPFRYSAETKRVWSIAAENSKPGDIPEVRTNRVRGHFWPALPD